MYFEKSRYIRSVSHTLNADRVVLLDGGDFPDCKFKGCCRQRQKEQLFFCKENANREQNRQARLNVMPRCSFSSAKTMQIESRIAKLA